MDPFRESLHSGALTRNKTQNDVGKTFIHCSCGDEFDEHVTYVAHRSSGLGDCKDSPVFGPSSFGSGSAFSKTLIGPDKQLAAFFGDLEHKREVVNRYQTLGGTVQSFFDGKHMAWYILSKYPNLVDAVHGVRPSVKTLATIFEYHFHVSVFFRFAYLRWLPKVLDIAPSVGPDGNLPTFEQDDNGECGVESHVVVAGDGPMAMVGDRFYLPIRQRDPAASLPPGDPNAIFGWANQEKYWRAYPEIMGYDRQAAFRTAGDHYSWFVSSVADYDGRGSLFIRFPARRSPFDGEEAHPSLGQLDGLSHHQNDPHLVGFRVAAWAMSEMVTFDESKYSGIRVVVEVPKRTAFRDGAFINYIGPPKRRAYFQMQRFVMWQDGMPSQGPRPESPGPGTHDDL